MEFKYFTIASFVFIILTLTLVFAAPANKSQERDNNTLNNVTFGQCVSSAAILKNSCYEKIKSDKDLCIDDTTNLKKCNADYKLAMKKCKSDFKVAKNECKKIKHNFFETLQYALK
jgi:hypothetical protein